MSKPFIRSRTNKKVDDPPTPEQKLQRLKTAIQAIISDDVCTVVSCIPGNIDVAATHDLVLGVELGKPRRVKANLLHLALHHRAAQCAKLLLHLGAPTEVAESDLGDCAIHSAVRLGSYDLVNLLLEYGSSVRSPNAAGETPLHLAAGKGLVHISKVLLDAGADPLAKNRYHETCWDVAALAGSPSATACADIILTHHFQQRERLGHPFLE